MSPPTLPLDYIYTPYYCEENIYLLADTFSRDSAITRTWGIYIVFVSNALKTVALWNQKLAQDPKYSVIWDYHCILVLKPLDPSSEQSAWVFDYDSRLKMPHRLLDYIDSTFGVNLQSSIPERFQSFFRVVPANDYLEDFASDRSHMLVIDTSNGGQRYSAAPPKYTCIVGPRASFNNVTNNLMSTFVTFGAANGVGIIMSFLEFSEWASLLAQPGITDENTTS